ncbi:HNH endonuclease signature motif containing protein [Pseudomonas chlororaphis]|uniref:HNH endonuclease signature motif containing protein n=1 Tax=Pseudomonas chlororaphis TaxID=587753 RepID=UPI0005716657|nr:HNH endonuclease signature motif containing protein [Pseudomonas chlororaphis]
MSAEFKLSPLALAALTHARSKLLTVEPPRARRYWTAAEEEMLKARYPNERNEAIAADLGRSVQQIYGKASRLGLKKSEELLRLILADCGRQVSSLHLGKPFKPGQKPWNTGLKGIAVNGRAKETQFKPGHKPNNWLPIGCTRTADGYLQRKVTDTGYPPADWIPVHVLLWEEHNGPVPAGQCVCFIDGNKSRIVLENLELITRAERMRRNTIHRYPEELKSAIRAVGKLKRVIREVEHEKQD